MNQLHLDYLASEDWRARLEADLVPWIDRMADLGDDVLEVGPGPGLTTDILRVRTAQVTAIEVDESLASSLTERLAETNVTVVHADAATVDLPDDRFSAATCFSVLHHIPTPAQQDAVFAAISRMLRPGASLLAVDTRDIDFIRDAHSDDTFVPLDAHTLEDRLLKAGFASCEIEVGEYELRFVAVAQ